MFGRKPKDPNVKTRGMRFTEGLLPVFGPAQVGDSTSPVRPASAAEKLRDETLHTELTRVVGPDGHTYVVAVPVKADPGEGQGDAPAGS